MSDLTPQAYVAIAAHMNDDHPDAVVTYARHFGNRSRIDAARIIEVDALGMTIQAEFGDERWTQRILFDHELVDRADARKTLVALLERIEAKGEH